MCGNRITPLESFRNNQHNYTQLNTLLCSRFVIIQTFISMLISFWVPFGFLNLINLGIATTHVLSFTSLSLIVTSPWVTGLLSPFLLPISILQAYNKQWILPIDEVLLGPFSWIFQKNKYFRFGVVRHFYISSLLAIVFVPCGFLSLWFLGPVISMFHYIVFACVYISCISLTVMPLSIVTYMLKPNIERIQRVILWDVTIPTMFDRRFGRQLLSNLVKCPIC
jgi:hypothetical protein